MWRSCAYLQLKSLTLQGGEEVSLTPLGSSRCWTAQSAVVLRAELSAAALLRTVLWWSTSALATA